MKLRSTYLFAVLLVTQLSFAQQSDCSKNVFFYFDHTESVYAYPGTDIDGTLRKITSDLIGADDVMKDGFGYGLYLFKDSISVKDALQKITPANRSILKNSVEALTNFDTKAPYNDYQKLFKHIAENAESNSLTDSKYPGYVFLLTDLLYDRKKISPSQLNGIKKSDGKAYLEMVEALRVNNYRLMIIYVYNEPKSPQQHYYVYKDIIYPNLDKTKGIVEIIDCSGNDASECNDPRLLGLRLRQAIDGSLGQQESEAPRFIIADKGCFLKIPVVNNSCDDDIHIKNITVGSVKFGTKEIYKGGTTQTIYNNDFQKLESDSLNLPPGEEKIFYVNLDGGCPDLFTQENLRNSSEVTNVNVIFSTDFDNINFSLTAVSPEVRLPEFTVSSIWAIDLSEIHTHNVLRIKLEPNSTKAIVPYSYKVLMTINGVPGCNNLSQEFTVSRKDGQGDEDFRISYPATCLLADADSVSVIYTFKTTDGETLYTTPPCKVEIKHTSTWKVFGLCIAFTIVLLIVALYVKYRLGNKMIKNNKRMIQKKLE